MGKPTRQSGVPASSKVKTGTSLPKLPTQIRSHSYEKKEEKKNKLEAILSVRFTCS